MQNPKLDHFLKTLGPGILFASTAIGVSHLVQSTRAGADFGFALIPFVLAANLFKYPFFEYGSRYANATGESIIDGYKRIGTWMLGLYFLITLGSMFFVAAAVGAVTAGFLQNLFGISGSGMWGTGGLFALCVGILMLGRYKILDSMIKLIGAVLLLSTLLAFILALSKGGNVPVETFVAPDIWSNESILFIIALMGWMPTAVDLSAWNSLWTIARIRQTGYHPTMKETLFDFNFGYLVSTGLSMCFVTLGAYMMFGSGDELPDSSSAFANSVVEMFTSHVGDWSFIIIAASSFAIMFGTCIAIFDGYARSLQRIVELISADQGKSNERKSVYTWTLVVVGIGSFGVVFFLGSKLKELVDLATTISFLIAPVIAVVNFRLVIGNQINPKHHPPLWLKALSWMGILFLTGFALYFAWLKLT